MRRPTLTNEETKMLILACPELTDERINQYVENIRYYKKQQELIPCLKQDSN